MGMYDTVNFSCPKCETDIEVQSKAGDCNLEDFSFREVPPEIAKDIDGEEVRCKKCDSLWAVIRRDPKQTVRMGLTRV